MWNVFMAFMDVDCITEVCDYETLKMKMADYDNDYGNSNKSMNL